VFDLLKVTDPFAVHDEPITMKSDAESGSALITGFEAALGKVTSIKMLIDTTERNLNIIYIGPITL
jgi:hypothetical protein